MEKLGKQWAQFKTCSQEGQWRCGPRSALSNRTTVLFLSSPCSPLHLLPLASYRPQWHLCSKQAEGHLFKPRDSHAAVTPIATQNQNRCVTMKSSHVGTGLFAPVVIQQYLWYTNLLMTILSSQCTMSSRHCSCPLSLDSLACPLAFSSGICGHFSRFFVSLSVPCLAGFAAVTLDRALRYVDLRLVQGYVSRTPRMLDCQRCSWSAHIISTPS